MRQATLRDSGAFTTIEQFIIEQQRRFPHSTGAFSRLLRDISVAAKIVNRDMRRAGVVGIYGETGETNVQGEVQQKMDALAHAEFVRALRRGGECCLIGSEEAGELIPLMEMEHAEDGKYIVLIDPLDGSSNIDVNVSVGTIFSVFQLPEGVERAEVEAALQPGIDQIAAGYVVYGSSTMLVYTTGDGVNGFTLDPSIGEFLLTHPDIRTPRDGTVYSINEGYRMQWADGLARSITWMQTPDEATGRPYKTRYVGSFVSDVHRNLLKGGIYISPATPDYPDGKLRLMYEANPMAMIVEQAGGKASDGCARILEKRPDALHQRTPIYLGSTAMVDLVESFLAGRGAA